MPEHLATTFVTMPSLSSVSLSAPEPTFEICFVFRRVDERPQPVVRIVAANC
jgi:hypothetical protein